MIQYGECGHPIGPHGRCRVCPLNPQDDRDSNPIGEARLAHFYGDAESSTLPGEWLDERKEWRGREDEANTCAPIDAVGVVTIAGLEGALGDWAGHQRWEVEDTIARICPPSSRRDGNLVGQDPAKF